MKSLTQKLLYKLELAGYMTVQEVSEVVGSNKRYAYIKAMRKHGVDIANIRNIVTGELIGYKFKSRPQLGISKSGRLVSNFNNTKKISTHGIYKGPSIWKKIVFRLFTNV